MDTLDEGNYHASCSFNRSVAALSLLADWLRI